MSRAKKLRQLLSKLEGEVEVRGSREVEISGITADSRTAAPGSLFIAKKGENCDGSAFIQQAVLAGSVAVVTDFYDPFLGKTQLLCKDPTALEAQLAALFYDTPSKELYVVGVTGSKGKTTTSYLIHHLLEKCMGSCGLVGTVETVVGERRFPSTLTTHDAIQNQKLLKEMLSTGARAAVLEVSSHGLIQNRVDEIAFDTAVFTNLFPDHLDYHKTMDAYVEAKAKLFEHISGRALLNVDNPWAWRMRGKKEAITFGIETSADIRAKQIRATAEGLEFIVEASGQRAPVHSPLMGHFNVYNLLAATAVGIERGFHLEEIARHLASFRNVPGRLERIPNERGIHLFVDYAHTGEALENVLKALKEIAQKRIICLFGCGGNRDPQRRESMAKASETFADLSIVTSDNPRHEDPEAICQQILTSFQKPKRVIVEIDRKQAIAHALSLAEKDDIVLIAGKGHEKVQIFSHQTIPFDDVEVAKDALFCHSSHH